MTKKPLAQIAPFLAATTGALALAACQTADPAPRLVSKADVMQPPDFVAAACGDCHGMVAAFESPNPDAPSFPAIANREGVTEETLSDWLVNAHNYPETMDFELKEGEVEQVVDYMLTLRRKDYVPEQ